MRNFEFYILLKNEAEKKGAEYALKGDVAMATFFANAAKGFEDKAYGCCARTGIESNSRG